MKVNIHGLSEATITFNTLGITIRGNDPKELSSIARGIDLVDEHQINEVRSIERIGLIKIEEIPEGTRVVTTREAIDRAEADYLRAVEVEKKDEKEDNSDKPIEAENKESSTKKDSSVKESRKRKKKEVEEVEEVEEDEEVEVIIKDFDESNDSTVVVMTETGPKRGDMVHDMRGEIDENDDRCQASMEAARQLEEEENEQPEFIDESFLDPSERMGSTAVIGTGGGKSSTVAMKNTAFGNKPDPNFLDDLDLDEEVVDEEVAEEASAFIDNKVPQEDESDPFIDDGTEDELGDAFIEI